MKDTEIIESLAVELESIGILSGDVVIAHSSFKALGFKTFSPADVIYTMLKVLGPEGTLIMPTFTYSYAGIWDVKPFDVDTTPGPTNGILAETLRQHPQARRSAHPTFSVAAVGRHAERITTSKENSSPLGEDSAYAEAMRLGAKILLIGVGNTRNSALHYAEVLAGLPYNDIPFREFWGRNALVTRNGQVEEVELRNVFPACSSNFGVADNYLDSKGLTKHGRLGKADSIQMDAHAAVQAVAEKLNQSPAWLLCDNFVCEPCTLRRKRLHEKGLI